MATQKTTWQEADDSFRKQVRMLQAKAGIPNLRILAEKAGLKQQRMYTLVDQPRMMRVGEIRLLMILFRKYGMELNVPDAIGGAI